MPSNHLILCRPLLLPSIFPSIRVFFNESALRIRWPKYWSSSFNSCPSNEYWGLISFRMDWLDPLGSFYNTGIGRLSNQGFSSPLPQWSCFTNIRRLLAQFTVSHGLGGHGRGLWRFPMSCSLLCTILEPRSPLGNFWGFPSPQTGRGVLFQVGTPWTIPQFSALGWGNPPDMAYKVISRQWNNYEKKDCGIPGTRQNREPEAHNQPRDWDSACRHLRTLDRHRTATATYEKST